MPKFVKPPLPEEVVHQTKIRVIGIGGGGSSIVSEIAPDVKRVDFVAANTDDKSLKELAKKVKRFQFGQNLTKGLGTGMNDGLGELAAQNEKERIKKLLEGQDLCIIVACLGGGTSSGASPIFAKISRSLGNLTYGIFTLPFEFEGEKKMEIAQKSLEKLKPNLNAYSIIPNERIFQIVDKNTPLKNALSVINKKLAENLEGLIEMIYLPGLINIDFADLRAILQGRGRLAYLNTIEIEGSDKEESIKKVISTPLYPYTIKGARGILYNINGGKNLQLSEVSYISKTISESGNKKAKIIFGVNQSKKYQNEVKITLLATGCDAKALWVKLNQEVKPEISKTKKIKSQIARFISKKKSEKIKRGMPLKKKEETKPRKVTPFAKKQKTEVKLKTETPKHPVNKSQTAEPKSSQAEKIQQSFVKIPVKNPETKKIEVKIRRNGLQLKKVIEQEEKEILEQEKIWETPAILRRKMNNK